MTRPSSKTVAVWVIVLGMAIGSSAVLIPLRDSGAADSLPLTLVSQTSSTITLGWTPQAGYGYLFFQDCDTIDTGCVLVSRTNNASASTVRFAKGHDMYKVSVIVEGNRGTYTTVTPPPTGPPTATFTMAPSPAVVGQNVTFDWTGTCPAGGCTQVWEDEGPDGPGGTDYPWGTGDPLVRSFAAVGIKYAHLVVTDSLGATAEARQQLTVGSAPPPVAQCADGVDNDSDGKIDLADPGCSGASDNDETDPAPPPVTQCSDGIDNDGDTKVDLADPGCVNAADTDETDTVPASCTLNATPSNFASQVSAATAGQTVCLATGNYGTWTGVSKAITVRAADNATPQMQLNFGSGASGFTLSGMTGMGGAIGGGANNLTISNSTFTSTLNISGGSTDGIVLDGNTHNWNVGPSSGGPNAKLYLENSLTGTLAAPSVTVRNSQFKNGDLDGIHFGGGSGYQILNNTFDNLCDAGANHTDNMQFDTSVTTQVRIAGNYVQGNTCETQGITSYDHGTSGVIIENNVVDIPRPWGIELYADVNSIVRHNTLIYRPASQCFFNTTCGKINVTNKSGDPVSVGTQVYDNLGVADIGSCTGCSVHHNVSSQNAVYVGPTTFHDGFLLAASSPVGKGAASDGTDVGVYANGS